jgi:protein SCO1
MRRTILALGISAAVAIPVAAQHEHHNHAPKPVPTQAAANVQFPDTAVTDQNGKQVHFYSDLVRGKVVVVNFIFTSCTTICPTMGVNYGQLQKLIGPDVHLVSVSIDPAHDTPARLKAWSQRWQAGPRWTLVTGSRADIDNLRKAVGLYSADIATHTPITLVGNDRTGTWTRVDGLAPARKIAEAVKNVQTSKEARR